MAQTAKPSETALLDIVRAALGHQRRISAHPADRRALEDEARRITQAISAAEDDVNPAPAPVMASYE